jgi:hypothetical protein
MTTEVNAPAENAGTPSPNDDWQNNPALDDNGNPVENPTPTPEPTPEAKPEPEATPEPAKLDETSQPKKDKTFDSGAASQVQPFLEEAGLVPAEVAKAVTDGDGEVSIEIMKALVEKHGEGVAGLIKDKLTNLHKSNVEAGKAADARVFNQLEKAFEGVTEQSGAETFKELAGWAKENLDTTERKEINKLLAQGGKAAELAIDSLVNKFKTSDSFVSQPAELMAADGANNEYGGKPLDKVGYDRELRKLLNEGHNYDTSPEIAALNNRRLKSRNRGY